MCTAGDERNLLESIRLDNESYLISLKLLRDCYVNPRNLCNDYVAKLIDPPALNSATDAGTLKRPR